MLLITALSISSFVVMLTILAVGIVKRDGDIVGAAFCLLVVIIFAHLLFQAGAYWQRDHDSHQTRELVK